MKSSHHAGIKSARCWRSTPAMRGRKAANQHAILSGLDAFEQVQLSVLLAKLLATAD